MIFVTIGTQLPFNRLVKAVDAWAGRNPSMKVFAQVGPGADLPQHMEYVEFVPPSQVTQLMNEAELIVSHAGMGSVLTALRYQRNITHGFNPNCLAIECWDIVIIPTADRLE